MKNRLITALIFTLLLTVCVSAQMKKLRWSEEMCDFEGTYNSKKYSAAEIKNVIRLKGSEFNFNSSGSTVWRFDEIAGLDLAKIEREYKEKSEALRSLKIVNDKYWESVRQQKLREIEQYYLLSKATMLSYTDPPRLNDYPFAESCKTKYAAPLIEGGDSILRIWEVVNMEIRKNNSDPNRIRNEFEQQRRSPDALKYGLVEVTAFGWWNCANALIDQGDDYTVKDKNLRRLFTRFRTVRCEEP